MAIKICLLSDHHVCINPRLWKEAFYYEKKGYEVVILSMRQSKQLLEKDFEILKGHRISYKAYLNLTAGEIQGIKRFFYRLRNRLAAEMQRFLKIGIKWAISAAPELMLKKAIEENANLYVAHLECAFYVGRDLIKAGKKVAFDFEDWYSHDYLVPQRAVSLLNKVERYALMHGLFCTTTSQSMAAALNEYHHIDKNITVIYNGFPEDALSEKEEPIESSNGDKRIKLLWFSRNIGPDRGIEYLLKALENCTVPVALHLLGMLDVGYKEFLNKNFPFQQHQLILHSFMPHHLLAGFISKFDIGLAIEENINENKSHTISNKILQYLQVGVPVLATNTKGQKEVADYFPATVCLVDIEDVHQWEDAIQFLSNIAEAEKQNQKKIYQQIFSWQAQEKKLDGLIEKYL